MEKYFIYFCYDGSMGGCYLIPYYLKELFLCDIENYDNYLYGDFHTTWGSYIIDMKEGLEVYK
jgi:hypothetical protein